MPNPIMPYVTEQDSQYFMESPEDPAMRTDMEGGYEISRARFTRAPRRTYTSGFTRMTQTQKDALDTFYDSVKGGSVVFDWTHPQKNTVMQVRFTKAMTAKYAGRGGVHYWDIQFEVRTA